MANTTWGPSTLDPNATTAIANLTTTAILGAVNATLSTVTDGVTSDPNATTVAGTLDPNATTVGGVTLDPNATTIGGVTVDPNATTIGVTIDPNATAVDPTTAVITGLITTIVASLNNTNGTIPTTDPSLEWAEWIRWFYPTWQWLIADNYKNMAYFVMTPLMSVVFVGSAIIYYSSGLFKEIHFAIKSWWRKKHGRKPPKKKKKKKKLNFIEKKKKAEREERERRKREYLQSRDDQMAKIIADALRLKANRKKRMEQHHAENILTKYYKTFTKPWEVIMVERERSNSWSQPLEYKNAKVDVEELKSPIVPKPRPKPPPMRPPSAVDIKDNFQLEKLAKKAKKERDKQIRLGIIPANKPKPEPPKPVIKKKKVDPQLAALLDEKPEEALLKSKRRKEIAAAAENVIPETIHEDIQKAFDKKPLLYKGNTPTQAELEKKEKMRKKLEEIKKKREAIKEMKRWAERAREEPKKTKDKWVKALKAGKSQNKV